jgi:hypothetical protein
MHPDHTNAAVEDLWPGDRVFFLYTQHEPVRVVSIENDRDRARLVLEDNTVVSAHWDTRIKRV